MWPLLFLSGAVHASQQGPLQIEDALETLIEVGPIALSPDGSWVAYTVQDNHKRRSARDEQYLQFTRTGSPISLLRNNSVSSLMLLRDPFLFLMLSAGHQTAARFS